MRKRVIILGCILALSISIFAYAQGSTEPVLLLDFCVPCIIIITGECAGSSEGGNRLESAIPQASPVVHDNRVHKVVPDVCGGAGMEDYRMEGCGMEDYEMEKHGIDRHGRKGKGESRAGKYLLALLAAALLAVCLAACGNRPGDAGGKAGAGTEAETWAFGMDLMQGLALQNPAQVACGQASAYAITAAKDGLIYQYEYESENSMAGQKEIEWRQGEEETLLNVMEWGVMPCAEVQTRADGPIEIRRYSGSGRWQTVMTIAERDMEWEWYVVGGGFFLDSSENAYFVSGDTVTRFDQEGKRSRDYALNGKACFFLEDSGQAVECVAAGEKGLTLYELKEDGAEKKWTLDVPAGQACGIRSSDGGTLCLAAEGELLFIDRESGGLLGRADLVTAGLPSAMAGTYDADAGSLRVYGMEGGMGGNLFCGLLGARDSSAEQRTEIVYGTLGWYNRGAIGAVKAAVMRFNQENENYYVTIRNYYSDSIGDDFLQRLHAEMAAGTAPDIIDMTYTNYYQSYVRNGYLEDLTPYLEQSQYADDILWNILEPYRVDGGLYLLTPQFSVEGVMIHPDYAGSAGEWNMDAFLGMLEEDGWDKDPFDSYGGPAGLLRVLLAGRQEEFIDRDGKKASFQSTEFTDLLELCREYGEQDWPDRTKWSWDERRLGTLCSSQRLHLFWQYTDEVGVYGRDYPLYGYPTTSGQVYGVYSTADCCAIYAGSRNKEGAWEFVESLLGDEYQNEPRHDVAPGLPLRRSLLEEREKEAREMDVTGRSGTVRITDSELQIIEDVICNGKFVSGYLDTDIWNVVQEETAYYFAGDKSAEEVAEIIQNRVQLILNE